MKVELNYYAVANFEQHFFNDVFSNCIKLIALKMFYKFQKLSFEYFDTPKKLLGNLLLI